MEQADHTAQRGWVKQISPRGQVSMARDTGGEQACRPKPVSTPTSEGQEASGPGGVGARAFAPPNQ